MARRSRKGKGKNNYDWTTTKVSLEWTTASTADGVAAFGDSLYIDGAQCSSIMNRKLVRQGQLFKISNMKVYSDEFDGNSGHDFRLKIGVIPTNWVTKNAYTKAKALWNEMNDMATKDLGGRSILPKWHDFKVFMNYAHKAQVVANSETSPLPVNLDNEAYPAGEWEYSKFADSGETSDEYFVHMLGKHRNTSAAEVENSTAMDTVGIIHAYAQSRALPVAITGDPNVPANIQLSPWGRLFGDDDQTHEAIENLDADNDMPPYDYDGYIGADHNAGLCTFTGRLQESNIGIVARIPTFHAPLGLIQVEVDAKEDLGTLTKVHIEFDITPVEMM